MIERHSNPTLGDLQTKTNSSIDSLLNELEKVSGIFKKIEEDGDHAVQNFADLLGSNANYNGAIPTSEVIALGEKLGKEQKAAIDYAASNIEVFHSTQHRYEAPSQPIEGLTVWRKPIPFHSVGLLINGGSQPEVAKLLSLSIPAKLAGCDRIAAFISNTVSLNPALAYAAHIAGVTEIHLLDHTVAIAASTVGTSEIPKMDKLLGADQTNQVVVAKRIASLTGLPVDFSNEQSSYCILFDDSVDLSTVEKEVISALVDNKQNVLVFSSLSKEMNELDEWLSANDVLKNNESLTLHLCIVSSLDEVLELIHDLSPSELWLAIEDASYHAKNIRNVANVFVGPNSLKSVGQYVGGPNVVVPSNGLSRRFQAVGLDTFIRKTTFQEMNPDAKTKLAKAAVYLGRIENRTHTVSAIDQAKK